MNHVSFRVKYLSFSALLAFAFSPVSAQLNPSSGFIGSSFQSVGTDSASAESENGQAENGSGADYELSPSSAETEGTVLLLLPDKTLTGDKGFNALIEKYGGKIVGFYTPNVVSARIDGKLSGMLRSRYSVTVYSGKADIAAFSEYGAKAVLAAVNWNKNFIEEEGTAEKKENVHEDKAGEAKNLCWAGFPDSQMYTFEISSDKNFRHIVFSTDVSGLCYTVYPGFFNKGYWRAGPYSNRYGKNKKYTDPQKLDFRVLIKGARNKWREKLPDELTVFSTLQWQPCDYKYYRIQVSDSKLFEKIISDSFVKGCRKKASELGLRQDSENYVRVMPSDGISSGLWSNISRVAYRPVVGMDIDDVL